MNELHYLQEQETEARRLFGKALPAVSHLQWPDVIDPNANGQIESVRIIISEYLHELLALRDIASFAHDAEAEFNDRKNAAERTEHKIQRVWDHRPQPIEKLHKHRRPIPKDYNFSEQLYQWANGTIGPLHDTLHERQEALSQATIVHEYAQAGMQQKLATLSATITKINAQLQHIAAKPPPPPPPHPTHNAPRPRPVSQPTTHFVMNVMAGATLTPRANTSGIEQSGVKVTRSTPTTIEIIVREPQMKR